jgi:hypothetical protein
MALKALDRFVKENPEIEQTDSVKFRKLLAEIDGHVFLVMTDPLSDGSRIVKHRKRSDLLFETLADAAVYFHKPNREVKYWVLKKDYRTVGHLMAIGLL